jgi:hypothetical protein
MQKYCTAGQAKIDNLIRRMRIARWILNATDKHSEIVIYIVFPLQQWMHERVAMLRYTCIPSALLTG